MLPPGSGLALHKQHSALRPDWSVKAAPPSQNPITIPNVKRSIKTQAKRVKSDKKPTGRLRELLAPGTGNLNGVVMMISVVAGYVGLTN